VRIVIDTDAGVDDAQAIMMALTHPGATVEAITTVTGNVHINWVVRNVFAVLDVAGVEVPIYRGADQPLLPGHWQPATDIHGEDGLGNYQNRSQNNTRQPKSAPAATALTRLASEMPGELTLVVLGPMTNVALACKLDPSFPQKIKQLVFMGGTISAIGNTRNVSAEFNFYCDPEAALIVLDAFPQATMVSWETTMKHTLPWDDYDTLAAAPSAAGRFFHDTTLLGAGFIRRFRPELGYLLPDPLTMAITLEPDLILNQELRHASVELHGTQTRGQTVIDHLGLTGRTPNVEIVTEIDMNGVYRLFEQTLA
jgi:purine nucleosidase